MRSRAIACVVASSIAACAHKEIPQDLSKIPARKSAIHAKKVALLPLIDSRLPAEGSDDAEGFDYRGIEYTHTALTDLSGPPLFRITEMLAQHLARAHIFDQVILVLSPDQAPEADLIMQGHLRRMRGYVEARPPDPKTGRPKNERYVLAEVFFEDIEVRDAKQNDRILLRVDAGWSIDEKRMYDGDREPDPWPVLGEALHRAVSDFASELEHADLSGKLLVKDKVRLNADAPEDAADAEAARARPFAALAETPPEGWALVKSSTASKPLGWRGDAGRCAELRLEQRQTVRFNRTLGPYRPSLILWACPNDQRLTYDALEEFPARYIGVRADGSLFFMRTLGESNWPTALEELRGYLAITPPRGRYNFEVGGVPQK